jgi:hypothetical protein
MAYLPDAGNTLQSMIFKQQSLKLGLPSQTVSVEQLRKLCSGMH